VGLARSFIRIFGVAFFIRQKARMAGGFYAEAPYLIKLIVPSTQLFSGKG
jgi:hypothetical protein